MAELLGQMLLQIIVDFKFLIFMLLFFIYEPDWRTTLQGLKAFLKLLLFWEYPYAFTMV